MSRILVVAGTDSSGGAGLSRDTAMAERLNCSVSPVVTAVTVQTNQALIDILPIAPEIIAAQVKAAFDPGGQPPKAIKIGMIGTPEAALSLAQSLPGNLPIVLDPVLKSSSGGALMSLQSLAPLLPRVTLLTPNLEESARLSGCDFSPGAPPDLPQIRSQAQRILAQGVTAVLIKGGHGRGAHSVDHLFTTTAHQAFSAPRLASNKRGTGCSLATALTCALAQGGTLEEACGQAKAQLGLWLS
ncbi:MAG: phosphomethylpyrimidine kinase [Roseobacter sp. MedPE-SW]|nr:MAG: phosphomethylpyrimidine kinase [Roseobacter sp. MedPE-SW]